jgi:hypothetical protein
MSSGGRLWRLEREEEGGEEENVIQLETEVRSRLLVGCARS